MPRASEIGTTVAQQFTAELLFADTKFDPGRGGKVSTQTALYNLQSIRDLED